MAPAMAPWDGYQVDAHSSAGREYLTQMRRALPDAITRLLYPPTVPYHCIRNDATAFQTAPYYASASSVKEKRG